ncbi:MAG: hypothetical protein ACP6IY_22865 [Promethearchaeia archaeon]
MLEGNSKRIRNLYIYSCLSLLLITFLPWGSNPIDNYLYYGLTTLLIYSLGFIIIGIPAIIISLILLNSKRVKGALISGLIGISAYGVASFAFVIYFLMSLNNNFSIIYIISVPGLIFYVLIWILTIVSSLLLLRDYRRFSKYVKHKIRLQKYEKEEQIIDYLTRIQSIYKRIHLNDILLNLQLNSEDLPLLRIVIEKLIINGSLDAIIDNNLLIMKDNLSTIAIE